MTHADSKPADPNRIPWDIYVDERKTRDSHCLGFLVIPNSASFAHKLFKCRHVRVGKDKYYVGREIHWSKLHRGVIRPAMNWVDCFNVHRGAKFYLKSWPKGDAKELIILNFLAKFARVKQLSPPYNVAVLLDFDSAHAKAKIQNCIRETGRIARCYHFDSEKNDCLQCCDLLLGCISSAAADPSIVSGYPDLYERWLSGDRLPDSLAKRLVAGYVASTLDKANLKAYDLTRRPSDADIQ